MFPGEVQAGVHVESESAVGVDIGPEQRAQRAAFVVTDQVVECVVVGNLFSKPLAQIPDLHGLLSRYLGLPESGYDKPLFLGQGLRVSDVITPETLRFAAVLRANGQPVPLHTYNDDHSGTVNASLPDSVPFVRGLFG